MKNFTWKQWTAIGVIAAVVITLVVLHLVQPVITFAWTEVFCAGSFILGGVAGYLIKKDIIKQ